MAQSYKKLKLVSVKICPFVQRSVITLLHKKVDFELEYISLDNPPDWFKLRSPFGKVPILIVNDHHTIFESAVISEFLDEATPGTLLPTDLLMRALDRSWIEFGTVCIQTMSMLIHAKDAQQFETQDAMLREKFTWLENILGDGPYFNGKEVSLVDFAYAPLFSRLQLLAKGSGFYACEHCPKVMRWAALLCAMPEVKRSVVPEFDALFLAFVKAKGAYTAEKLALS